jgi:sulfite reductase (ferredoxin)
MGVGECAGEVVSRVTFDLAAAERETFEAQVLMDNGESQKAGEMALRSMIHAAKALVKEQLYDIPEDPDTIIREFKARFYDTQVFWDPFAGGKFGHYLLRAHEKAGEAYPPELAHQRIEEAQLVVEAAYNCYSKLQAARVIQPVKLKV